MIRVASPTDAPTLAALHDQFRADWPDFSPEEVGGVRSAMTDDGMVYLLLDDRACVCCYADQPKGYGFLDFPYAAPDDAGVLLRAALDRLQGLRVECPLPTPRTGEAAQLLALGFMPGRSQRRMLLTEFPAADIVFPPGTELVQPGHADIEALHDLVFSGASKTPGWRTDPGIQPGLGLSSGGTLAGYVLTAVHGGHSWLWELAVHPGRRRQGLGRLLALLGLRQLRELGATEVHLMVNNDHNQNAPALYESVGFVTRRHVIRYTKEHP